MEKYCPLTWLSPKNLTDDKCERNECSWWDKQNNQCAILTLLTKNTRTSSVTVKQEPNGIGNYFL